MPKYLKIITLLCFVLGPLSSKAALTSTEGWIDSVTYGDSRLISEISINDPYTVSYRESFEGLNSLFSVQVGGILVGIDEGDILDGGEIETIWEDNVNGVDRLTISGNTEFSMIFMEYITLIAEDSTGQAFTGSFTGKARNGTNQVPVDLALFDHISISYDFIPDRGTGDPSSFSGTSVSNVPIPSTVFLFFSAFTCLLSTKFRFYKQLNRLIKSV